MKKILFQGDSITDAERSRENDANSGIGYPTLVSAELGYLHPGEYEFINRGISGNRSIDLLARIKSDIINLKPEVMSILIGVNDVWHEFMHENGVDSEKYEKYYAMIIEEITAALPDIKIMILEPFVLKASGTEEDWDVFRPEVEKRAAAAMNIAERFGLKFIPLMQKFDEAAKITGASYWLADGVHPTAAGHELIAREWIKAFRELQHNKQSI